MLGTKTAAHSIEENKFEDVSSSIIGKKNKWKDVIDSDALLIRHDLHKKKSFDFFISKKVVRIVRWSASSENGGRDWVDLFTVLKYREDSVIVHKVGMIFSGSG